jgi:hypothetical protein
VSYEVTETSCTCPDWQNRRAPGKVLEGTSCKHQRQARREHLAELQQKAGRCTDEELVKLAAKYEGSGRWDILLAIRVELFERAALQAQEAGADAQLIQAYEARAREEELAGIEGDEFNTERLVARAEAEKKAVAAAWALKGRKEKEVQQQQAARLSRQREDEDARKAVFA